MPITVFDLAEHRLKALNIETPSDGSLNGQHFVDAGLPMLGGCEDCGASIAAYNAYPSKSGYLRCADDIGDDGWDDVAQANLEIFEEVK